MQNNYYCIYPCINISERPSINYKISSKIIYGEKYKVFKKGYWVVCNAARSEQKVFEGKLDFGIEILSYDLKTDYIEDTLVELEKCYNSENIPPLNPYCDACRWQKETSKL